MNKEKVRELVVGICLTNTSVAAADKLERVKVELEQLKSQQSAPDVGSTDISPNWDDAPEWANWLAQDEKYTWTWYAIEPHEGMGYFASNGYCQNIIFKNPSWRQTLQARPKPTPQVEVGQIWKNEHKQQFEVIAVNDKQVVRETKGSGGFMINSIEDFLARFELDLAYGRQVVSSKCVSSY